MPLTRGLLVVTADPALEREAQFAFPADFDVVVVRDAREAADELAAWTPAAVVVDLLSGSAGGYALGSDMSQDARLAQVPLVMMLDRHQDRWLAERGGAAACLIKPIDTAELVEGVLDLVGENAK